MVEVSGQPRKASTSFLSRIKARLGRILRVRHATYPELEVVKTIREFWEELPSNKYELYHYLYRLDPEVRGAIDKMAILVSASFHGLSLIHI